LSQETSDRVNGGSTLRVGLSHERHNLRIGTPDDDPALYARK